MYIINLVIYIVKKAFSNNGGNTTQMVQIHLQVVQVLTYTDKPLRKRKKLRAKLDTCTSQDTTLTSPLILYLNEHDLFFISSKLVSSLAFRF